MLLRAVCFSRRNKHVLMDVYFVTVYMISPDTCVLEGFDLKKKQVPGNPGYLSSLPTRVPWKQEGNFQRLRPRGDELLSLIEGWEGGTPKGAWSGVTWCGLCSQGAHLQRERSLIN